jgi:hypothetical protein
MPNLEINELVQQLQVAQAKLSSECRQAHQAVTRSSRFGYRPQGHPKKSSSTQRNVMKLLAAFKDEVGHHTRPCIKHNGSWCIIGGEKHELVPASSFENFIGYREAKPPIVAAIPGGGWLAEYLMEEGKKEVEPVLAWLIDADGDVQPVVCDSTGYASNPHDTENFTRVYYPGEALEQPREIPADAV